MADDDLIDGGDLVYISSINAVNINRMSCSPSADVHANEPHLNLKDPGALRAQINTGTNVSCTEQLYMLHQHGEFNEAFPSPIKMMLEVVKSNAVSKGYG